MEPLRKPIAEGWVAGLALQNLALAVSIGASAIASILIGSFGLTYGDKAPMVSLVSGVGMLLCAVLLFFMAKALLEHRNWARIVELLFCYLGILLGIAVIGLCAWALTGGGAEIIEEIVKQLGTEFPLEPLIFIFAFIGLLIVAMGLFCIWLLQIEPTVKSLFKKPVLLRYDQALAASIVRGMGLYSLLNAWVYAGLGALTILLSPVVVIMLWDDSGAGAIAAIAIIVLIIILFAVAGTLSYLIGRALLNFRSIIRIIMLVLVWIIAGFTVLGLLATPFIAAFMPTFGAAEVIDSLASALSSLALYGIYIWFLSHPVVKDLFKD